MWNIHHTSQDAYRISCVYTERHKSYADCHSGLDPESSMCLDSLRVDKELKRNPPSAQHFNRHSRVGGNPVLSTAHHHTAKARCAGDECSVKCRSYQKRPYALDSRFRGNDISVECRRRGARLSSSSIERSESGSERDSALYPLKEERNDILFVDVWRSV